MDRNELRPFDVPMRLLGQQREIDRVGDARVQQIDHGRLGVRLQIVLRLVQAIMVSAEDFRAASPAGSGSRNCRRPQLLAEYQRLTLGAQGVEVPSDAEETRLAFERRLEDGIARLDRHSRARRRSDARPPMRWRS